MGVKQTNNLGVTVQKDRLDQSMNYIKIIAIQRNHFDFMYVIGKGGFGKVKQFKIISFNNSGLESFFQKI